jgi:hypothetical protein
VLLNAAPAAQPLFCIADAIFPDQNEKRLEAVLLISWLSSMVLLVQYLRSKI